MKPPEAHSIVQRVLAALAAERKAHADDIAQRDSQADQSQLAIKALQDDNAKLTAKIADATESVPDATVADLALLDAAFPVQV